MALEKLGKTLRKSLRRLARAGYIDEETLNETVKEIQRALLSADVNVKLVFKMSEKIKERADKEKPKAGLTQREHIVNIVYEELLNALGGEAEKLELKEKGQTKIMLVGLFGSGKTTTTAKLAKYFKKKGLKVAMIGTDVWRPAAFEQLKQLGEEANVDVFGDKDEKNPVKILKKALPKTEKHDVVIVDSAGRDALDKELGKELTKINKVVKPDEKILVLPADIGQKASEQATGFDEAIGIDGVILTKMDSSAKGGGALSACASVNVPIKFVGLGERIDDFEEFDPTKFISKMLGMGDLESLIKKTKEIFGDEQGKSMAESMMKGKFTLKDMYTQIQSMKKVGPLKKVMEMLPTGGMGMDISEDKLQLSQERIDKFTIIMDSMTPEELENPDKLGGSRVKRIAEGSGTEVEDVRALLKHYNMTKKMMKKFGKNKRNMKKLLKGMNFKGRM
ncbi:MAG: signal recognition particle protein Srp54 [Candidatus Undinarchaeales archaeon]